jgi:phosphatidylethanolamine/phosphatidyl-N-methylethanolamine N-methyltransferase
MTDGATTVLMRKAYARWAPIYDLVYDKLTEPAARAAVNAAVACGPRVLEAGVGTGLSLGYYPMNAEVFGVDLSEDMLRRAQEKVDKRGLTHVKSLQVMDVTRLGFPNEMFDAVTAQFIITLVPEPEKALAEFARVLKPGGEIVLANHFGQPSGPVATLEELASPVAKAIGWSSAFKASRVEDWARTTGFMDVVELKPLFPAGFFKLMRIRKRS